MKMTTIGRIAIALAAISCGQSVWYWNRELRDAELDGVVVGSPKPSKISGQKNSFQIPWN